MLTAIVADDEKIARKRLVRLIEETGDAEVVAACAGGREAVEQIDRASAASALSRRADARPRRIRGAARASPARRHRQRCSSPRSISMRCARSRCTRSTICSSRSTRRGFARRSRARRSERSRAGAARADDERMRALIADYVATTQQTSTRQPLDRVAVKVDGILKIVRTADVDWWETDGNYIRLHVGGTSHLIRMTAASIEPQLDPRSFIRIHRRYIVNVDRIVEVQPWFAGDAIIVLRNGAKLRLSRTYRERLHNRLGVQGRSRRDRGAVVGGRYGFGAAGIGLGGVILKLNDCSTI